MASASSSAETSAAFEVDAIVFDCDGVLVRSLESAERCWRAWAISLGLDADLVVRHAHSHTSQVTAAQWLPADRLDEAVALIDRLELDDAFTVTATPGAAELVASLPGRAWGVATSATRALFEARVHAAGLPQPAVAVTADDITHSKPDPEVYATALRTLGVDPARAIVLEDTVSGIRAARAAGVRWVIRIGTGEPMADEDLVLADMTALRWADGRLLVVVGEA